MIANRYDEVFGDFAVPHGDGPLAVYVLRVPHRDVVRDRMRDRGVETQIYYQRPLGAYDGVLQKEPTPNAQAFCSEALALPYHEGLREEDVVKVIETLQTVLGEILD